MLIVIWVLCTVLIGVWARRWGRSVFGWVLASQIFSPLLVALILLICGNNTRKEFDIHTNADGVQTVTERIVLKSVDEQTSPKKYFVVISILFIFIICGGLLGYYKLVDHTVRSNSNQEFKELAKKDAEVKEEYIKRSKAPFRTLNANETNGYYDVQLKNGEVSKNCFLKDGALLEVNPPNRKWTALDPIKVRRRSK